MSIMRISSFVVSSTSIILLLLFVTNPVACSSSSSSKVIDGGTQIAVSNLGKNIALNAGVSQQIIITKDKFDIDKFGGPIDELVINLNEHLQSIELVNPAIPKELQKLEANGTVSQKISGSVMTIRVARFEERDSVCSSGELYGPFDIELEDDFSASEVMPPTTSASQATLDIVNTGGYSVCVVITPVINATANLDFVEVDLGNCDEEPAEIAGSWTGTYSCTGIISGCDEAGTIDLTITQDGDDPSIASYTDDGGATYTGRVCGNRFSFQGGVPQSYDESGTFLLNSVNTASKTSSYKNIGLGAACSAQCTDSLTRM